MDLEQLRHHLRRRLATIPASYPKWTHNRAVAFKTFVVKAGKKLAGRHTAGELSSLINEYDTYL